MKMIVDTNVLLRSITRDHEQQAGVADQALRVATQIVLPLQTLCELVWVLTRTYRRPRAAIIATIRELMHAPNVVTDRQAVRAGLAMMEAGCDFADGIIAFEGQRLGGDVFLTFDREAAHQLTAAGTAVELLA